MSEGLADEHSVFTGRLILFGIREVVIDVVGEGRVFGAERFLGRGRLWLGLLNFELEFRPLHSESHGCRAVNRDGRNPLSAQKESVGTAEIAHRPLPVLKHNLGMGAADERVVD